ncbi:hypothetical protein Taro_003068 [Colocasia esculenta]|uniref:Uncharacterized protein n=1 Tax=Colocasia esculenta TaxID=4460 RepID=A0A843TMT3_COLES|nr:hypothetical protein [Colocasia esculenta]
MTGLVATEVPITKVIPVATAFGVAFLSRPVNGMGAIWSRSRRPSQILGRRPFLPFWHFSFLLLPEEEKFPLSSSGGSGLAERRRLVRSGVVAFVGDHGMWIPSVGLLDDVATAERVVTSEKASARSDTTLSRPGWPTSSPARLLREFSRRWACSSLRLGAEGENGGDNGVETASPSHCLTLRWLRSHIGRKESVAGELEEWTVPPPLSCLWRWLGCSCCDVASRAVSEVGFACEPSTLRRSEVAVPVLLPHVFNSAGSAVVIFGLTQIVVEAFLYFPLLCSTLWLTHLLSSGRDSLSQEFVAGRSWWWFVRRALPAV